MCHSLRFFKSQSPSRVLLQDSWTLILVNPESAILPPSPSDRYAGAAGRETNFVDSHVRPHSSSLIFLAVVNKVYLRARVINSRNEMKVNSPSAYSQRTKLTWVP